MKLVLRQENANDHYKVEELTREAFWGYFNPTCDEHYLAHLLRNIPAFVQELDYVAEADGRLVGNIMYTKAKVVTSNGGEHEVLTFGPLSVLPEYWNCGVGSALVRHTILKAKKMGYRAIVIYGHPDYYLRFGFRSADIFGITTPDGKNFDALMAMPLYDGALDGISGAFHEDPIFNINKKDAIEFDKRFPHKEPAAMPSIDILLSKLEPPACRAFIDRNITTLSVLNTISGREMLKWDGIDERVLMVINKVLKENGYPGKLLPSSDILNRAKLGIHLLENVKD